MLFGAHPPRANLHSRRGLKLNPAFLRLQIVERWNGKSPLVVPADVNNTGAALLLPLGPAEKPSAP